jgi:acyl-coenzyme A synthetase/AMP-(fatty) acid ligase
MAPILRAAVIEDLPNGATTVWSFDALDRQANRLANTLAGLGVQPGE